MRGGGIELEAGVAEVSDWIGERKFEEEMKRIGDMRGGRDDWVVARWSEFEAWTEGLNAKLPTGM
jgi:hypothetical protein